MLPPAPYVVSCLVFLSCLICLPVHPVHPNPNNLSLSVLSSPPQNHYGSAERSNWPSEQNKPIDFISSSRKKWNPITNGCETAIAVAAAATAMTAHLTWTILEPGELAGGKNSELRVLMYANLRVSRQTIGLII